MIFAGIDILATVSALILASSELPKWCYPERAPKLVMTPITDDINFVYSESSADLGHYNIDTISPYSGQQVQTRVGGLSEGRIQQYSKYKFRYIQDKNAQYSCLSYDEIEITFHIKPVVYIAKENKPGTCKHHAIKEHELKHVKVDREMVNKYLALLGNAIREDMKKNSYVVGPIPTEQAQSIQNGMKYRIDKLTQAYFTAMQQERMYLQQKVDSLEEYERVSKACDKNQ